MRTPAHRSSAVTPDERGGTRLGLVISRTPLLLPLLALGAFIRVVLAFATYGDGYDMGLFDTVAGTMRVDPISLYESASWPYPPLYAMWSAAAHKVAFETGLPFHGVVQLLPIGADIALAAIAAWHLGRGGASPRRRLAAAAAIALGPIALFVSGWHGQLDSIAILPAVLACLVWQHGGRRRGLWSGLLVGLGIGMKTVPGLVLIALLPTARSRRELVIVIAAALVVPGITLAPYFLHDASTVATSLRYHGLPGAGGLSLLAQPSLARSWGLLEPVELSRLTVTLDGWSQVILAVGILGALVVLRARTVPALEAAVFLWLVFLALGANFFFQYLVWLLPFLVLINRVEVAVALQVAAIGPAIVFASRPWESPLVIEAYIVVMLALWVAFAVAAATAHRWLGWSRVPPRPARSRS